MSDDFSCAGFSGSCAAIDRYGDGWQDYWKALMANGTKIAAGWTDAYYVDFSGPSSANVPIMKCPPSRSACLSRWI